MYNILYAEHLHTEDPVTFRNWSTLEPPISRIRPRSLSPRPGLQSDVLSRNRSRDYRECQARAYHCDQCRRQVALLFPVSGAYVCLACRDGG
jgi:hypothetical protein